MLLDRDTRPLAVMQQRNISVNCSTKDQVAKLSILHRHEIVKELHESFIILLWCKKNQHKSLFIPLLE